MAKHHWNVLMVTKAIALENAVSRAEGMTQWTKYLLLKHGDQSLDPQHSSESWYSNALPEAQDCAVQTLVVQEFTSPQG